MRKFSCVMVPVRKKNEKGHQKTLIDIYFFHFKIMMGDGP